MEGGVAYKVKRFFLVVILKHTSVTSRRGASAPNSHSHTRARGVGEWAQCVALVAHFALRPLESRLNIFEVWGVVND